MEIEVSENPDCLCFYIYCDQEQMERWRNWDGPVSFQVQSPDGQAFFIVNEQEEVIN